MTWINRPGIAGHWLTKFGKEFIVTARQSKVEVGLFRMQYPLPNWALEQATTDRFLDWVDEINENWYDRINLGRLIYNPRRGVVNPEHPTPSWVTGKRPITIDGSFYVTKKSQELISVDIYYYPLITMPKGTITYDIAERGMCRVN